MRGYIYMHAYDPAKPHAQTPRHRATARSINRSCNSHCSLLRRRLCNPGPAAGTMAPADAVRCSTRRKKNQTSRQVRPQWKHSVFCISLWRTCLFYPHINNNSTLLISPSHPLICGRLFTGVSASIVRWNLKHGPLQAGRPRSQWAGMPKTAAEGISAYGIVLLRQACSSSVACLSMTPHSAADVWPGHKGENQWTSAVARCAGLISWYSMDAQIKIDGSDYDLFMW